MFAVSLEIEFVIIIGLFAIIITQSESPWLYIFISSYLVQIHKVSSNLYS